MNKIKNSKILITGGAGFVGSYVVEQLIEKQPRKIIVIDNMLRGTQRNMMSFIDNPLVEFIEGDIRDNSLMEKTISSVDYVFHLAALRITRCSENQKEAFEVMVQATFNIIDLCKNTI